MRIDLHTHSSVSDGTDSPTRLVIKAQSLGLDVIALTDHDTFSGNSEAIEVGRRIGLTVLQGLEMSAKFQDKSIHLLAYGCDPLDRELGEELRRLRAGRYIRIETMVAALNDHGIEISVNEVLQQAVEATSVGRPHIADVMVNKGFVTDRAAAFNEWLGVGKKAYVERYGTRLDQAIQLIHDAKGVAVIAHPWSRGADQVLDGKVVASLVNDCELEGIEVDHPDHDDATRSLLFDMGARLGLIRTGGSDYHGIGKSGIELGSRLTRDTAYFELLNRIKSRGGTLPG